MNAFKYFVGLTAILWLSVGIVMADATILLKVYPGDDTPPSAVTDLQVIPPTIPGEITIKWTAPGNNNNAGRLGSGSQFHITTTTIPSDALDDNYWYARGTTTLADIQRV